MKKTVALLCALMMVLAIIPAASQAKQVEDRTTFWDAKWDFQPKEGEGVDVNRSLNGAIWTYDFETNPWDDGWTTIDADGDGYTWGWAYEDLDYPTYTGLGVIHSESYVEEGDGIALTPDNYLVSPAIEIPEDGARVSFYASGMYGCAESFAIYCGTEPSVEAMQPISERLTTTPGVQFDEYSANLKDFAGQTVYIAIRHYDTVDMFSLLVDSFTVWENLVIFNTSTAINAFPGDFVEITVSVGGVEYEAHTLTFSVNYNNEVLQLKEVFRNAMLVPQEYQGSAPNDIVVVEDITTYDNSIRIGALCPTTGLSGNGDLVTFIFEVIGNEEDIIEDQLLDLEINEFRNVPVDGTATDIPCVANDGYVNMFVDNISPALNAEGCDTKFKVRGEYIWVYDGETFPNRTTARTNNQGVSNSSVILSASVELIEGDVIRFDYYTSSEESYDLLTFNINGTTQLTKSGNTGWKTFTYTIGVSGLYDLEWIYYKDNSVNKYKDTCWLDEVYIGTPTPVTGIEVLPELEVPLNSFDKVEHTVLPASAFNKNVTFESNDSTIATVNANGLVIGVSEGQTFVTVTTEDGDFTGVCEITVVASEITRTTLYGSCYNDYNDRINQNKWISFEGLAPQDVTAITDSGNVYSAAYAYGRVYGYKYIPVPSIIPSVYPTSPVWSIKGSSREIDGSFQFFSADINDLGSPNYIDYASEYVITDMAYDYTTFTMYAIAIDADSDYSLFGSVDVETGELDIYGPLPYQTMTLAINEAGVVYSIGTDGYLYTIDLDNGNMEQVGYTGVASADSLQSITYDFNNGGIYLSNHYGYYEGYSDSDLYLVDTNTGVATGFGNVGGGYGAIVTGLFMIPDEEPIPPWAEFTITYTINGEYYDEQSYHYGDTVVVPDYDVPEWYVFSGWEVPDTMVGENITVDATLVPVAAPDIEALGVELRARQTEDSKADLRFIFKVNFNDYSYIEYEGEMYGPTNDYFEILGFYTALQSGDNSVIVDGLHIYSMADDQSEFLFTAVVRNIIPSDFDTDISAVGHLVYRRYGNPAVTLMTEPITASVNGINGN